jgi:hypothetical protein
MKKLWFIPIQFRQMIQPIQPVKLDIDVSLSGGKVSRELAEGISIALGRKHHDGISDSCSDSNARCATAF